MPAHLKRRRNFDQSPPILLHLQSLDDWVHPYAGDPDNARCLDLGERAVMLERQPPFRDTRDARLRVDFYASFNQGVFNITADFFAHSRHQTIRQFDDNDAWLAPQGSS